VNQGRAMTTFWNVSSTNVLKSEIELALVKRGPRKSMTTSNLLKAPKTHQRKPLHGENLMSAGGIRRSPSPSHTISVGGDSGHASDGLTFENGI